MLKSSFLQRYIYDLQQLVAIESPTNHVEGMNKIIEFCQNKIVGLPLFLLEKKSPLLQEPCAIITNIENFNFDREPFDILLLAHMDTVYPVGTTEQQKFYIENNKAYGAGVIDDKGGLLLGLNALENIDLDGIRIVFFINSNEEIGSPYNNVMIQDLARRAKYCLCLEAAREDGSLVDSRMGVLKYNVNIKSKRSNNSVNNNPLVILSNIVHNLSGYDSLNEDLMIDFRILKSQNGGQYIDSNNINLIIAIRFSSKSLLSIAQSILNKVKALEDEDSSVDISILGYYPAMEVSSEVKKMKFIVEYLARQNYISIKWQKSLGGSDGCFASNIGCPTLDGLGPIGGNFHSEKEYLDLESVIPRCKLLVDVINKLVELK